MKYISDDAFMAKCKSMDFSVESANYDKNLEILKGKLADINEERCSMNKVKRIRKPFAILAAVIAIMAMSAAALATTPALRNRAVRAVQHECGSITVSMTVDAEETSGSIRVTQESDGVLVMERDGVREIINVYNAADLCPDDELVHGFIMNPGRMPFDGYTLYDRPDTIAGLEAFRSYTAEVDEVMISHFVSAGNGVIQVGDHTYFYRMVDEYGNIVSGTAVAEADGAIYFVADCGERTLISRP